MIFQKNRRYKIFTTTDLQYALNHQKSQFKEKLVDFLEEFNYGAISLTKNRRYDFIIDTTVYFHTENKLNDLDFFKSINGKDIDFTLDNNSYYPSFINDKEATDIIDFINNSYHKEYQPKLTIKQFKSMLSDNPEKRT